jgi:hypothetical protein
MRQGRRELSEVASGQVDRFVMRGLSQRLRLQERPLLSSPAGFGQNNEYGHIRSLLKRTRPVLSQEDQLACQPPLAILTN